VLALPACHPRCWWGLALRVTLDVQPSIVPALVLTALMAASVGYAMGHAISNPQLTNMVTNLVVFFVLLFSPIAFPPSGSPVAADGDAWLPFEHMAAVVRASLAPHLVPAAWRATT